ncbi:MAG: hypothetical protein ACE5Q3_06710, partial [Alphaproteobacteria bacterium]
TTNIPPSVSSFFLLMNKEVWEGLSPEEQAWVDEASGPELSRAGGRGYDAAGERGLKIAAENGVELIELSEAEVKRFQEAIDPVIKAYAARVLRDDITGAQVIETMGGVSQ